MARGLDARDFARGRAGPQVRHRGRRGLRGALPRCAGDRLYLRRGPGRRRRLLRRRRPVPALRREGRQGPARARPGEGLKKRGLPPKEEPSWTAERNVLSRDAVVLMLAARLAVGVLRGARGGDQRLFLDEGLVLDLVQEVGALLLALLHPIRQELASFLARAGGQQHAQRGAQRRARQKIKKTAAFIVLAHATSVKCLRSAARKEFRITAL